MPSEQEVMEIQTWWENTTGSDLAGYLPKLAEYGSNDLKALGVKLAYISGWDDITDAEAEYLGCLMYLEGKLARSWEAIERHELPSDDTDHDMTVYTMMMRKARR